MHQSDSPTVAAEPCTLPVADGRCRAVIEGVSPEIDGGRFPVKRVSGEQVVVEADIFCDGHDAVAAVLLYRDVKDAAWTEVAMRPLVNDRWRASFGVGEPGSCFYTIRARIDHFTTWLKDLEKRFTAGQELAVDRRIGVDLVEKAAARAEGKDRERLMRLASAIGNATDDEEALAASANSELAALMDRYHDPALATPYGRELEVTVEPPVALFSTWYELFPRSATTDGSRHGTFRDCERLLPEIARMGFDVVYLPPIHPIGVTNRKGKNNATVAGEDDPGCPWAIGHAAGGHTAVHPELGTLEDFTRFVARAGELGIQVAIDIAFQCSPDHPYVADHPEWFRWRPDGTVQYAENPPKKYQDVIPFDFETDAWQPLWEELRDIFLFWAGQGVTIFRVDNPHTKPFPFWEYVIRQVKGRHPEAIFLSEAFTRPKVMYRLAKLGFSQSYTYFCWRNTRRELEEYLTELSRTQLREYFRPNFWPNTPDILPEFLQYGGRPAFAIRYVLAATLSASCGIYGPPFELYVDDAIPGREEYLDSEKYEIRVWDWEDDQSLRELISRLNRIRHENSTFWTTWNVTFCETDNDNIICYIKADEARSNIVLVAVCLDPFRRQEGAIRIPLEEFGIDAGHPFLVTDLLSGERNIWHSDWNRLEIDPHELPARICLLRPRLRRENDFDYFL